MLGRLVSTCLSLFAATAAAAPGLILFNGRIFTGESNQPTAQALAIDRNRVVAVGGNEPVKALAGSETLFINLGQRLVVPGFNDAHYHHGPSPKGKLLELKFPEPTWKEVLNALTAAVAKAPPGSWIFGTVGSVIINDESASRSELDRLAPKHPVLLTSWFGHGHLLNSQAMARLKVSDEQTDVLGGWFVREGNSRKITGKFFEYSGWPILRALEESLTDEELLQSICELAAEATRLGITSIQNMTHISPERYVTCLGNAKILLRMRVIRWPPTDQRKRITGEGRSIPIHPGGNSMITVSGTKYILDGTPLERGMALRGEYHDRPGHKGRMLFPETEIQEMLRESTALNDPLLVHAVGDRAIASVLGAMEKSGDPALWKDRRVRIEHGDGLLPDLISRARKLGVVVVQNPTHFDPALTHISERLGANHKFMPLRSLLEAGIPIALGSDGPLNPGLNILFASQHPAQPGEAISREQAIRAYTSGSAYAEFAEGEKGKLAVGMLADLAVLSQDILSIPAEDLPKTVSLLTIVDGRIAHDAGLLPRSSQP